MSSSILRLYKYKNVQDISEVLSVLFIEAIQKSAFANSLKNTLLVPVPISYLRKSERGFNQMEYITNEIGKVFQLDVRSDLLYCKNSNIHQASKNKMERYGSKENPFYIKNSNKSSEFEYKSITLIDDVITTGNTLEKIAQVIKIHYGMNTVVNALCMFRGKPYYLSTSQPRL
jgi:ComF family protein